MRIASSLTLPRNGAQRVRESWQERFAETPDVLKSAERQQTVVPVLDLGDRRGRIHHHGWAVLG